MPGMVLSDRVTNYNFERKTLQEKQVVVKVVCDKLILRRKRW